MWKVAQTNDIHTRRHGGSKEIWDVGDEACGELLHPQIKEYVLILEARQDVEAWR